MYDLGCDIFEATASRCFLLLSQRHEVVPPRPPPIQNALQNYVYPALGIQVQSHKTFQIVVAVVLGPGCTRLLGVSLEPDRRRHLLTSLTGWYIV